jgi:hypothetical protein
VAITAHRKLKAKDQGGNFKNTIMYAQFPKSLKDFQVLDRQPEQRKMRQEHDVVYESEGHDGSSVFMAGRVLTFLQFVNMESQETYIVALLHMFRTVTQNNTQQETDDIYNLESPRYSVRKRYVPFSYMKLDYLRDGKPNLCIIDTDYITSPAWTQSDFDNPENVWFLRFWKDKDSQCSLFLPRVGEQTQEEEEADEENLGQGFSTCFEGSNTNYYYSEDEEEYDIVEEEAAHQIYNSNN